MASLFCEGGPSSLDVRLIELARYELEAVDSRVVGLTVLPAGSKGAVATVVLAARANGHEAVGLRDRDYLPALMLTRCRTNPKKGAFPLSWHCIETYLLASALAAPYPGGTAGQMQTILDEEADILLWPSIAQGVIDRYNRQHLQHAKLPQGQLSDRPGALVAVTGQLQALQAEVRGRCDGFDAAQALDDLQADFALGRQIWTRVDGSA